MKLQVGSKYYEARERIRKLALVGNITVRPSENEACYFCGQRILDTAFVVEDEDAENYLDIACYYGVRNCLN